MKKEAFGNFEMKKIVGGFKPEFSISQEQEDHFRRPTKEIFVCSPAYMQGVCTDPVFVNVPPCG